ncbi:MAG: ANTAR domain-containing protein [Elusimicrobiota bacterium]|nr:ANTAR domain-containing protein [Elusimicrobiota bacterium]
MITKMEKDKIIIGSASKELSIALKKQLDISLFSIIYESSSGNEILRMTAALEPDIIITDYILADNTTGLDIAESVEVSHICPVIVLANEHQIAYSGEMKNNGSDIFLVPKPLNSAFLNKTASLAIKLSRTIKSSENVINDLKQKLENRKILEKAKGLLMEKFKMSENEAYSQLRKKSMDLAKPIEEVAKSIINTLY